MLDGDCQEVMGVIQDFSIGASHGVGQRVSHAVSHEVSHGIGDHGVNLGVSHCKSVMSLVIEVVMGSVLELAYSWTIELTGQLTNLNIPLQHFEGRGALIVL